jgi:pimeloyl-ACP methyl ester carboxylesterase
VSEELTRPIPHFPGRLIQLGDHEVYLRSVTPQPRTGQPRTGQPRTGEPALCLHGLEGSSRNWTDLMQAVAPRLACDAVDLPGFGDSPPRPDGRYSIDALAQTVITLLDRPVHLIGNSLGGAVAVRVAARRPDLVRSLTLISPALPDPRPRKELLQFPLLSTPKIGIRLVRELRKLPPERRVADVIAGCYSDPSQFAPERFAIEVAELIRRDARPWPPAALVGCARALTAEALRVGRNTAWRDAARITAPTLVIYGGDDRLVPARQAGRAARTFAGARVVVLPRTGHVAHMEHPDLVAAEIEALLTPAALATQAVQPRLAREFPLTHAG